MIVMSFDLSTVCIGITVAEVDETKPDIPVLRIKSCPILPPKYTPEVLGYHRSKKNLPLKSNPNQKLCTYWKTGETYITKSQKKKRDTEVRSHKDIYTLQYISKSVHDLIYAIKPDIILAEKNAIFNGILTTVLLAKTMGTLIACSGVLCIPFEEYTVQECRHPLNVPQTLYNFTRGKSEEELLQIEDVTKRALRQLMEEMYGPYGLKMQTDDESDSCVVFHFWRLNKQKEVGDYVR